VTVETAQTHPVEIDDTDLFDSGSGEHVDHMGPNTAHSEDQDIGILHFIELLFSEVFDYPCQLLVFEVKVLFGLSVDGLISSG
jgi:hypothetical protein